MTLPTFPGIIQMFLSKGESLQPLGKELKKRLSQAYYDEFEELENVCKLI